MRPYELPQQKYVLWYQIGERLGAKTQSLVANALCGDHHISIDNLIRGEDQIILELAQVYRVVLLID